MNKIMIAALACGMAIVSFAADAVTNVYDMTMSLKVPYLNAGVRSYSSQKLKGLMYLVYDEGAALADVYAVVTNSKTKVRHHLPDLLAFS